MLSEKFLFINSILTRQDISLAELNPDEMSFLKRILSKSPKITNKKLVEKLLQYRIDNDELDVMPNLSFLGVNLISQVNSWLVDNLDLPELDTYEAGYFEGQPSDIDDDVNKGLFFAHNILVEVLSGRIVRGEITSMPKLDFTGVTGAVKMESAAHRPFVGFGDDYED